MIVYQSLGMTGENSSNTCFTQRWLILDQQHSFTKAYINKMQKKLKAFNQLKLQSAQASSYLHEDQNRILYPK